MPHANKGPKTDQPKVTNQPRPANSAEKCESAFVHPCCFSALAQGWFGSTKAVLVRRLKWSCWCSASHRPPCSLSTFLSQQQPAAGATWSGAPLAWRERATVALPWLTVAACSLYTQLSGARFFFCDCEVSGLSRYIINQNLVSSPRILYSTKLHTMNFSIKCQLIILQKKAIWKSLQKQARVFCGKHLWKYVSENCLEKKT